MGWLYFLVFLSVIFYRIFRICKDPFIIINMYNGKINNDIVRYILMTIIIAIFWPICFSAYGIFVFFKKFSKLFYFPKSF